MCFNWPVCNIWSPRVLEVTCRMERRDVIHSLLNLGAVSKYLCQRFSTGMANVLLSNIKYASIPQWVAMPYYRVQTANPVNHTCWVIHHILNWGLVSHARGLWYSILVLLSTLRTIAPFCCIYSAFCYWCCYLQPQTIMLYINLNEKFYSHKIPV